MTDRLLLALKQGTHRVLGRLRGGAAGLLRRTPIAGPALGLARHRIHSIPRWVERTASRAEWVSRGKGPYCEIVVPETVVTRRAPRWMDGALHPAFARERVHLQQAIFLARIPDARVLGPTGTIVTPDGGLVEESTWSDGRSPDPVWTALRLPPARRLPGHFLTIAGPSVEGYAHWIMDALPRLFGVERLGIEGLRIIVPRALSGWQRETLEMLGIDPESFVTLEEGPIRPQFLYLPSHVGSPGNLHPWGCSWLRERFLAGVTPGRSDRRVYVSRRGSARRRVVNEDEIEPLLRDFGFEIVETERLGMREKVKLFAEAEVVAGPHGAGLTNILFAPPGCRVLEIFEPSHVNVLYYSLADLLDQPYAGLIGTTAGDSSAVHRASGHDDIRVDPDALARALQAMTPTHSA